MARLIEVQRPDDCISPLVIRVGDVLLIRATGARLRSGGVAVEVLGPFLQAVVGTSGDVVSPEGPPSVVLVRARRPGAAAIELISGDPWRRARASSLDVAIKP